MSSICDAGPRDGMAVVRGRIQRFGDEVYSFEKISFVLGASGTATDAGHLKIRKCFAVIGKWLGVYL